MITTADDERDAARNAHARDRAGVGKLDRATHGLGRRERHRVGHGTLRNAALARQDGSIGDEAHQLALGDGNAQGVLILGKIGDRL